jgi:predicted nucleic acid-binding protein
VSALPNLVDSSGWIEYFTAGPGADFFAPAIEDPERLLVASLGLLEVFRWVLREKGEGAALQAVALMQQGRVVELDAALAVRAARLGLQHGLPLAGSVIYATARAHGATLWTQDADFQQLPGVRYAPRQRA